MERTDQPPDQPSPDLAPRPNPIALAPATPAACAGDLRTRGERLAAAGAARDQLAFTRMAARGNR